MSASHNKAHTRLVKEEFITPLAVSRFWKFVDKRPGYGPNGDCWAWVGGQNKRYGSFGIRINGTLKTFRAARLAWFLHHGYWPEPFCLHKCDFPSCVRVEHLYAGDALANARDRDVQGRGRNGTACGENNYNAKISSATARAILGEFRAGATSKELSAKYRTSWDLVRRIGIRKTWRCLDAQ
jgi:hypothetical protein